ncbi:MAG: DUF3471 domain-containing protein, partial [Acidobacteria bacterium]
ELAVQDINAAGGVLRTPVEMVSVDEAQGAVAVEQLIATHLVDVVIGPASSSSALLYLDRLIGADVAVCSPAATSIALAEFPDDGAFVRTAPSDALQARALAELIGDEGGTTVAILSSDDPYGRAYARELQTTLEADGLTVTASVPHAIDGRDQTDAVQAALDARPEAMAVIGFPETAAPILATLADVGRGPRILDTFVSDGLRSAGLYERIDPSKPNITLGIRGVSAAATPLNAEEWIADTFRVYAPSVSTAFAAHAYDCTIALALATQIAGTDDAARLTGELLNVTRGGVPCASFADCKTLLEAGRNIDYDGVSGVIDLDDNGDPTVGAFEAFHFDANGTDIIWHNGETAGYHAFIGFDPARHVGVVILSNSATSIDDLGFHLIDARNALRPPPAPPQEVAQDTTMLQRYCGTYEFAPGARMSVTRSVGKLYAQITGQPRYRIFATSDSTYSWTVVPAQLTFHRDAAGSVTGAVLQQGGRDMPMTRVP